MTFEQARQRETADSLDALRELRDHLDDVCALAEKMGIHLSVSPHTKYMLDVMNNESMMEYREDMEEMIKALETEQVMYGDPVRKGA